MTMIAASVALEAPEPAIAEMAGQARARLHAIVVAEFDFVWRSLRRLGVPGSRVDDAAQKVFVVLSSRLAEVSLGRERSFLFGVARRIAAQTRRAAHLHRETGDVDLGALRDSGPSPEELVDRRRRREHLDTLLDRLVPELRAVLILHEGEGLTTQEIADLLDVPPGTAASRLRRARERMRELVTGDPILAEGER